MPFSIDGLFNNFQKRKCKPASESDMFASYARCNNSNNNTCLVEFGKNTFKCDLSGKSKNFIVSDLCRSFINILSVNTPGHY